MENEQDMSNSLYRSNENREPTNLEKYSSNVSTNTSMNERIERAF